VSPARNAEETGVLRSQAARQAFEPSEQAFAVAVDELHPAIHRLELQADDLGIAVAPLYLVPARGSLRHVLDCLVDQRGGPMDSARLSVELYAGTALHLGAIEDRQGVGERMRMVGRKPVIAARGRTLLRERMLRTLATTSSPRQIRRTYVADRLAPPSSATLWHAIVGCTGKPAGKGRPIYRARALVSAVSGGAGFPLLGPLTTGGLVDREVADLLKGIGWLRLVSPRMPERSAA
jgi:hypothetical protein